MVKKISVEIVTEESACSLQCPFFTLEPGASYERPFIERCLVFKTDLETNPQAVILRCPECMERDMLFHKEAAKVAMEDSCMGKEAALKLLKDTRYAINIYEYDTPKELLDALIEQKFVTREYLKRLLGIDDEHLNKLTDGVTYPYLVVPLQERLGFPKPKLMNTEELQHQKALLIRRSERVG